MKLRDYLNFYNITQVEFAKKLQSTQWLVNCYMSGKKRPSFPLLNRIIQATNGLVGIEDFYAELLETQKTIRDAWSESEIKLYDCYKTVRRII